MAVSRIVVIGASAGGLEPLQRIVADLPRDLRATVVIVCHMASSTPSVLPEIIGRSGRLPVVATSDGQPLRDGQVHVAIPDRHVLLLDGTIRLSRGPRENHHRPAIDPLFRAAARLYGGRAIGVVLSGSLDDGAAGLLSIERAGGVALVQAPDDALFPGMPRAALATVPRALQARAADMAALLARLVHDTPASRPEPQATPVPSEDRAADLELQDPRAAQHSGVPSEFVCPDCGGTLFELREGEMHRFRCRVGHAYSLESLRDATGEKLEDALWWAMRALQEHADLSRRVALRARAGGLEEVAKAYERTASDDERRAEMVRAALIAAEKS
jgi:two-component system chemotaxis response regulator CheB